MTFEFLKTQYLDGAIDKAEYIERMHKKHSILFEYSRLLHNVDIREICIQADRIVMTTRDLDISMFVDAHDQRIIPLEILNFGSHEKHELNMIFELIRDANVIYDIGANIGWYSLNISKNFPMHEVHAFEPVPSTFRKLADNAALNKLSNIRLHNFGFSNHDGEFTFYTYPEGSGNASMRNLSKRASVNEERCKVKTLDEYVQHTKSKVDFIKCDVEGAEYMVFKGGENFLSEQSPIIFTEMLRKWSSEFGYHPNEIIQFLSAMQYSCFTVKDGRLAQFHDMDERTTETNFFFLHTKKHADLISKYKKD